MHCVCENNMVEDKMCTDRASSAHRNPTRVLHASHCTHVGSIHPGAPPGAVARVLCAVSRRTARWKMQMREMSFLHAPHATTRAPRKPSRTAGLPPPRCSSGCSGACLASCVAENSVVEDANARKTIFLRARHAATCVPREPSCTRGWPTMQTVRVPLHVSHVRAAWEISAWRRDL